MFGDDCDAETAVQWTSHQHSVFQAHLRIHKLIKRRFYSIHTEKVSASWCLSLPQLFLLCIGGWFCIGRTRKWQPQVKLECGCLVIPSNHLMNLEDAPSFSGNSFPLKEKNPPAEGFPMKEIHPSAEGFLLKEMHPSLEECIAFPVMQKDFR